MLSAEKFVLLISHIVIATIIFDDYEFGEKDNNWNLFRIFLITRQMTIFRYVFKFKKKISS